MFRKTICAALLFLAVALNALAQGVGDPAPPFTHNSLENGQISLSDFAGKVVYLYFFGYNCPPCIVFGPITEQIHQIYINNPDVVVLGLDVWDGSAAQVLVNFKQPTGVTYPLLLQASSTGGAYGVNVDWNVVVDQNQVIRYTKETSADPAGTANEIISTIDSLLLLTGIDDDGPQPVRFELFQNVPNPFNPSTVIRFQLNRSGPVRLQVFNALGQLVRTLVDGALAAGVHQVRWDGTDARGRRVAAGVYLYRLEAAGEARVRKMVLLP
ncbi:MAG: T9SS C-terminal target domain-containing protein [Calditrichaeota bacterium]|nr:MAG: T9SS C-terminal target domain-containing protein [Calditrichota bacterium]